MDDLISDLGSVAKIAALYRQKKLSPREVVEACLERSQRLDPVLNAFITVTAETAREEAKRAEAELFGGLGRGLMHGVPVALKDLVDTAGVRTTCGSRLRADHVPPQDAEIVRRLKEAGAISLGKTNLLEFAYGVVHPDFGPTLNPWDQARTAGGSSGGSAAAVPQGSATPPSAPIRAARSVFRRLTAASLVSNRVTVWLMQKGSFRCLGRSTM